MSSPVITLDVQFVDIHQEEIYPARVSFLNQKISSIEELPEDAATIGYMIPGLIDSHVHIESSMLVPSEFARLAVVHGTVATVSDPHEIANVCGMEGVLYMIENGKKVPFKFNFGAPSCVPATSFETAGAKLSPADVRRLLGREDILYLSEMMNFPGVLNKDAEVIEKIKAAHELGKPVDGHAPGLRGDAMRQYVAAGIHTDHECFTKEEAREKLEAGMKVIIREGSAARNFEALIPLLAEYPNEILFCSDDKHPDSLVLGHINQLCARAIAKGHSLWNVLKAASINPVKHYGIKMGLLNVGDPADAVIVNDLVHFEAIQTYIDGQLVASEGKTLIESTPAKLINHFECAPKTAEDFVLPAQHPNDLIPVIEVLDGQLITNKLMLKGKLENSNWVSDTTQDILKIAVVNRYKPAPVAIAFIKNFGLKKGAIASSVAHDSHNIVAVGVDDNSIKEAVNAIIEANGGVSIYTEPGHLNVLPLPVAGLMSATDGYEVASAYARIDKAARDAGSSLASPFMSLSFMALLVIPQLKLSDLGLFDADRFEFVNSY